MAFWMMDPLDYARPSRIMEQRFGLPLEAEDLVAPLLPRELRNLARGAGGAGYLRPWRSHASQKDFGSTVNLQPDKFQVHLDVQQFRPEEIKVKLSDTGLLVQASHEEKEDEHGFVSRQFVRRYVLPKGHDLDKVESRLSSDGVLTIVVPKVDQLKEAMREIPIVQTWQASLMTLEKEAAPEQKVEKHVKQERQQEKNVKVCRNVEKEQEKDRSITEHIELLHILSEQIIERARQQKQKDEEEAAAKEEKKAAEKEEKKPAPKLVPIRILSSPAQKREKIRKPEQKEEKKAAEKEDNTYAENQEKDVVEKKEEEMRSCIRILSRKDSKDYVTPERKEENKAVEMEEKKSAEKRKK